MTKAEKKKARQTERKKTTAAAAATQPPTRRVSDAVLMRMLDEHMQDSLSDIGAVYQRLTSALGFKAMQFQEHIRAQTSMSMNDRALDIVAAIVSWRKDCKGRGLDTRPVMLIVSDGMSILGIMRALRMRRACVSAQLRATLAVWSVRRRTIQIEELRGLVGTARRCCV
jgi:hypothetical protein